MTMLAVQEGWLRTSSEAKQLDQATLEQVLLQRAWDELQAVSSYVERYSSSSSPNSKPKEE